MRLAALVRTGWGTLLLCAPRSVLEVSRAPDVGERSVRIVRLLGSRQVVQGTVDLVAGTPLTRRLGVLVDALHAASGVALAVASPRWRFTASGDAVLATAFAATGTRMDRTQAGRQQSATTITGGAR